MLSSGTCAPLQQSAQTTWGDIKEKKVASAREQKDKIATDFNTPRNKVRDQRTARAREVLAQRAEATDKRRRVSAKSNIIVQEPPPAC